jgi:hypothetical protein
LGTGETGLGFEERIYRKKGRYAVIREKKGEKKGLGSKNLFDLFDLAVKILL